MLIRFFCPSSKTGLRPSDWVHMLIIERNNLEANDVVSRIVYGQPLPGSSRKIEIGSYTDPNSLETSGEGIATQ